jgi:hypothetical protein
LPKIFQSVQFTSSSLGDSLFVEEHVIFLMENHHLAKESKMKKLIVSFMALAFCGAGAFADAPAPTLQISGILESGAKLVKSNNANTIGLYGDVFNDNTAVPGGHFEIDGNYVNGNNGVTFVLSNNPNATYNGTANSVPSVASAYTPPLIYNAFAWSNLFNNMISLKAGIIGDSTITTLGDYGFGFLYSAPGVEISATPVTGLTFLYFLSAPTPTVPATTSYLSDPWVLGAAYSNGPFAINASLSYGSVGSDGVNASLAYTGTSLFFAAEASFNNFNDYANTGDTTLTQKLTYTFGSWTPGVTAYEYLYGSNIKDSLGNSALGYKIFPFVDYAVDKVTTLELGAVYFAGDQSSTYNWVGAAPATSAPSSSAFVLTEKNQAQLDIRPKATFALDSNTTIIAYYVYSVSVGSDTAYFTGTDTNANTFVLDLRYKF